MAERCPACMTDSACRAACHNRRRRGFLQARPPQGACSQRVFLGARRNRPRPRHMPCSLQIGGRLLWKGRTHFQKCTAGCLAGGRRTDSFTGRLHRRGPSCLFPPKQKRLPRGQNQAAQQAFAFCSLRPPQHTRAGTAFPPGGRKQFRLRRYTVRNRRQKTGGFGLLRRQRY